MLFFRKFMDRCLAPFSGSVSKDIGVKLKELQLERDEALTNVLKLVDRRRDDIRLGLSNDIRPRVRLSKEDLAVTVVAGSTLCQRWYEGRMWKRAKSVGSVLSSKHGLGQNPLSASVSFSSNGGAVANGSGSSSSSAAASRKSSFRVCGGGVADAEEEAEFWSAKGLPRGDWIGLSAHLLSEIFSEGILCFLEEDDTRFQLEVC
jgi:hypothetical protein